jgi:hypothetical protein
MLVAPLRACWAPDLPLYAANFMGTSGELRIFSHHGLRELGEWLKDNARRQVRRNVLVNTFNENWDILYPLQNADFDQSLKVGIKDLPNPGSDIFVAAPPIKAFMGKAEPRLLRLIEVLQEIETAFCVCSPWRKYTLKDLVKERGDAFFSLA